MSLIIFLYRLSILTILFRRDVLGIDLAGCDTTESKVYCYNSSLQANVDKHSPEVEKTIIIRPNTN